MAMEPDPVRNPMNFFVREFRTEKITDPELREKTIAKVDDHLQREKEAVKTYQEKAVANKAKWDKALNLLGEKNPVRKVGNWPQKRITGQATVIVSARVRVGEARGHIGRQREHDNSSDTRTRTHKPSGEGAAAGRCASQSSKGSGR